MGGVRWGRRGSVLWVALAGAVGLCTGAGSQPPAADWLGFGNSPDRVGAAAAPATSSLKRVFVLPVDGRITGQILADGGTFYAATTAGEIVAFTSDGYVRWRADVGQLAQSCQQLDGYGIVGTGVIDPSSSTLYVADAFARVHAFDLATGAERPGWPVRVFSDFRRELVWGALTLADGGLYVPTASYCDSPSLGGVYRLDLASQQVAPWISVQMSDGGGGGIWGWGGTAYSGADDALYAVTANAFAGGSNTDDDFSESAGYGEHLVQLSPDLTVEAASHPTDILAPDDLDFVGSPVVFDRPGCGELIVAADKNDNVYAWRGGAVDDGPIWELGLEPFDISDPLLTQLSRSPQLSSLYAVTGTQLVRIGIGADCDGHVDWAKPLGTKTENGSPTVAGTTVWFAVNDEPELYGYDGRSGERLFSAPLGGTTVEAPTIAGGRLVIGTMTGLVEGFAFGPDADPPQGKASLTSWVGKRLAWQSRANAVYATENGGTSWHRIFTGPALDVMRISKNVGMISVGDVPGACMCATRQYWTSSNGAYWHETTTLPEHFTTGGGRIYLWTGSRLSTLATIPRATSSSRLISSSLISFTDGTITDVKPIPGGVAALVSSRVHGESWDTTPRVVIVRGTSVQTVTLPAQRGRLLVQGLQVAWPKLTVTANDFVANPVRAAVWISSDGGAAGAPGSGLYFTARCAYAGVVEN
jgi:hypothetical protein